jgi:hypothetical protein
MFCEHFLVYINSKVPFHENLPPLPSHRSGVPDRNWERKRVWYLILIKFLSLSTASVFQELTLAIYVIYILAILFHTSCIKAWSNENESWEARVACMCESFLNSHAPIKREQEFWHDSWWELTGYYRVRSENSNQLSSTFHQNLNQFRVDESVRSRVDWILPRAWRKFSSILIKSWANESVRELIGY